MKVVKVVCMAVGALTLLVFAAAGIWVATIPSQAFEEM